MGGCVGAACDFERDYEIAQSGVMLEIERCVRGSDYGATSWTTRAQAEDTMARLALAPGLRLLEVGAGAGWPGLFLAAGSGCDVVLSDLPLSGLRIARARAAREGLGGRCAVVAADAAALPFAGGVFDCIHHADVLCCMPHKRELLRECRRVARGGSCMEFSVIRLAREPASDDERRLLQRSGPPYPDAGADYAVLLAEAGWRLERRFDVTAEFVRCMEVLMRATDERRDTLVALLGEDDLGARLERRRSTQAAVACGLLERDVLFARAAEPALPPRTGSAASA